LRLINLQKGLLLIKILLITLIYLLLTACGAKGDLYLPADKPIEQEQQPVDPEIEPEAETKQPAL